MRQGDIAGRDDSRRQRLERIDAVLEPLYTSAAGGDSISLRPVVAQAWKTAFSTPMTEPALSLCAAAIANGVPWQQVLIEQLVLMER